MIRLITRVIQTLIQPELSLWGGFLARPVWQVSILLRQENFHDPHQ